jgi:hypothetical protein
LQLQILQAFEPTVKLAQKKPKSVLSQA